MYRRTETQTVRLCLGSSERLPKRHVCASVHLNGDSNGAFVPRFIRTVTQTARLCLGSSERLPKRCVCASVHPNGDSNGAFVPRFIWTDTIHLLNLRKRRPHDLSFAERQQNKKVVEIVRG